MITLSSVVDVDITNYSKTKDGLMEAVNDQIWLPHEIVNHLSEDDRVLFRTENTQWVLDDIFVEEL